MSAAKVLFVDRDGTLIEEPPDEQVDSVEKIRLIRAILAEPSIQRRFLTLMFSASRCVDTFVLLPNGIFRESSLFARGTQLRLAHANTATKIILNTAI